MVRLNVCPSLDRSAGIVTALWLGLASPALGQVGPGPILAEAFTSPPDMAAWQEIAEPPGPSSRRTALAITEIHYHPPTRADGRELEFIEIYNSDDAPIDLSGFRLSGEVDYTFPADTTLGSRSFLVVAPVPGDLEAVYGIGNALGGFTNRLANAGGTLRLRNRSDAVLLEIEYDNRDPWPLAPDDTGHTLVLARPSYGENDPRAWAASDRIGGTPGQAETAVAHPLRRIVINEWLAHTDPPQEDFVELFNPGAAAVDLSGCVLTDDPATSRFVIPAATILPARGFVSFTQTQLGFAFNTRGETILLFDPARTRVVDLVRFDAQANGVSVGRFPDGAPELRALATPTSGQANDRPAQSEVVINEIMFNPPAGDAFEFIELHNRGMLPVDLTGWRLEDGVEYTFPAGFILNGGGYVTVARDATQLMTHYPELTPSNLLGNFQGTLANGGERIVLTFPDSTTRTNNGVVITDLLHLVADEVRYRDRSAWSRWADGGGSSLERVDAHASALFSANWVDSDESAKSAWTTVEHTGVLDHGQGAIDELHALLLGAGECLLDNVEVTTGSGNRVANAGFETGLDGWVIQGNHGRSTLSEPGQGDTGSHSLHLRGSGGGDSGANRVETDLTEALTEGGIATVRGRARWLRGNPHLLLRLRGNHLEATAPLPLPKRLGTPGAPNSRRLDNAGPFIQSVTHAPILPAANAEVAIRARVEDPDGLSGLVVRYRLDPSTDRTTVEMTHAGGGWYIATLPGQPAGTLAAFVIEATDGALTNRVTSFFPANAPAGEGLIRWGDPVPPGDFGVYRLWMTRAAMDTWTTREKLSNEPLEGTFVYGAHRVIHNAGARYRGSPWIRPGYTTPTGYRCAYVWSLPDEEPVLGTDELNLDSLEPGDRDRTALREITAFWMADQLGLPFSHQRFVHVVLNGVSNASRGIPIYTDSQQPDSNYLRSWFKDDPDGEMFKTDNWFEFDDSIEHEFNVGATLESFTTTGGGKKKARYRWNWEKKSNRGLDDDYTSLFSLVDALNAPEPHYVAALESLAEVEEWAAVFALRHAVGDWDGYGYLEGKNQFTYKPRDGRWSLLLWDLDFSLGCKDGHLPTQPIFQSHDPVIGRFYAHPHFGRLYLQAIHRIVHGPFLEDRSTPFIAAKYASLTTNQVTGTTSPFVPSGPQNRSIPGWIVERRTYLLRVLAGLDAPFAITSQQGSDFSTGTNLITLEGTAPIEIRAIKVNGVTHPIVWTSSTSWSLRVALPGASHPLVLEGFDYDGQPLPGATDTITVDYTGPVETPEALVVINELHYHPATPDTGFLELFNRSTSSAFDLSNHRLEGVDYTFPEGSLIAPGQHLVVAANASAFVAAHGSGIPIAGVFGGQLDNGGETVRLVRPGATPEALMVVDEVTYDDQEPWPTLADGFGPSLQLIDAGRDNNRVANWTATSATSGGEATALIGMTDEWRFSQAGFDPGAGWQTAGFDDASWESGNGLFHVETATLDFPKNTPLTLGPSTYYFRQEFVFAGNPAAVTLELGLLVDDGAVVYLNGQEILRLGLPEGAIGHGDFASRIVDDASLEGPFVIPSSALLPGVNLIAVEVHQVNAESSDVVFGAALSATTIAAAPYTPGAPNSVAGTLPALPLFWLNEGQPVNANGPLDNAGESDPWVELHYSGTNRLDLSGFYLSDSFTNLTRWPFPSGASISPGGYQLVWIDGEPQQTAGTQWHADFRLSATNGLVVLSQEREGVALIVDYLRFPSLNTDRSYGALPDGSPAKRRAFYHATPGAANLDDWPATPVFINEWMAGNRAALVDPADGDYDDWFELYNDGPAPVDLSGFTLTDNLSLPGQWTLPAGTVIPARGHLLVWADDETEQNTPTRLHASFKLSLGGEALGLFAPNGVRIDSVTFGAQTDDVSQGRWPDGNTAFSDFVFPTPGIANRLTAEANRPPQLAAVEDPTVPEGTFLSLTITATDPDPDQTLTFAVVNSPPGAVINPASGVFTWAPTEDQGPGSYEVTLRVTDDGFPALEDTRTFRITVDEVNSAPTLDPIDDRQVVEGDPIAFLAVGRDADRPSQALNYRLDGSVPAGAGIHPETGAFTWTPTEAQGPGTYAITLVVTDDGIPPLNAAATFTLTVEELNSPPRLAAVGDRAVDEGTALVLTLSATDEDLPAQSLSYELDSGAPAGSNFDPINRTFSWTPTEAQGPSTNTVTFRVTDPFGASDAEIVSLVVGEVNSAPVIQPIPDQALTAGSLLLILPEAADVDLPANALSWSLDPEAPAGATVNAVTGELSWLAPKESPATTHAFLLRLTDDGSPPLTTETMIRVTVRAPVTPEFRTFRLDDESNLILAWSGEAGVRYRLERRTLTALGEWLTVAELDGTGPDLEFPVSTIGLPSSLFRVVRLP
ncbi:MAG: lamin tail domain-containing protein [Limisphaerales bacterium]